jgi:predicted esterase
MKTLESTVESEGGQPVESGTVRVPIETHYLLQPPVAEADSPLLIVATHGYGMTAQVMLDLVQIWFRRRHWVASAEGPHGYYASMRPGEGPEAYNWGTRSRRDSSIATHHEILHRVIEAAGRRSGIPRERTVLAAFSQSVGMNYQFLARNPAAAGGIIGICGSPPRDWESNPEYATISEPALHFSRSEDEYYPPEILAALESRLRAKLANLDYHLLTGGHRFPSKAGGIVAEWEERCYTPNWRK